MSNNNIVKKNHWENNGHCSVGYVCCTLSRKSGGDFREKAHRALSNRMSPLNVTAVICDKHQTE